MHMYSRQSIEHREDSIPCTDDATHRRCWLSDRVELTDACLLARTIATKIEEEAEESGDNDDDDDNDERIWKVRAIGRELPIHPANGTPHQGKERTTRTNCIASHQRNVPAREVEVTRFLFLCKVGRS